jgi:hypothetical protein
MKYKEIIYRVGLLTFIRVDIGVPRHLYGSYEEWLTYIIIHCTKKYMQKSIHTIDNVCNEKGHSYLDGTL